MPALTLIVCGAPLARRTADIGRVMVRAGWAVTVIGTPASESWVDSDSVTSAVGQAPKFKYRSSSEPKRDGEPDVAVVLPATFNTLNKLVAGIADNYACSVLCSALGESLPILVAPMVNDKLWGHSAWPNTLDSLSRSGVQFLDLRSGKSVPEAVPSGTGDAVVAGFRPDWVVAAVDRMVSL
jgi:phosphopantothenoylcysteine synthetase/decarboxylase